MKASKDDIHAKINEYHVMIEEVLGGMDMMISRLESRVQCLEEILGIDNEDDNNNGENRIEFLSNELKCLKLEITEGLNLAFRKISENS